MVCIVWYNSSHGGGKEHVRNLSKEIELYESNAELLKVLAHPVRLCIVKGLIERGPSNVSTMYTGLNMPQSTISQHLAKLKVLKSFQVKERVGNLLQSRKRDNYSTRSRIIGLGTHRQKKGRILYFSSHIFNINIYHERKYMMLHKSY